MSIYVTIFHASMFGCYEDLKRVYRVSEFFAKCLKNQSSLFDKALTVGKLLLVQFILQLLVVVVVSKVDKVDCKSII